MLAGRPRMTANPAARVARSFPRGVLSPRGKAGPLAKRGVFAGVLAAAAGLFVAFEWLPFMDLPAHAGLIALRARIGSSRCEQAFYVVAPHLGGYSVFRGLGELFARLTSPVGAVRGLAIVATLAVPGAVVFGRRRLHGDRSMACAYLAIVAFFGPMTVFGFVSYWTGLAALLVALTCWLLLMDGADRGEPVLRAGAVAFGVSAPLLVLAHGFAFALFVALAVFVCVESGRERAPARLRRLVLLGPALGLAAYSVAVDRTLPSGAVASVKRSGVVFSSPLEKLELLITPTLTTRFGIDVLFGVVLAALIGSSLVAARRAIGSRPPLPTVPLANDASAVHARTMLRCAGVALSMFLILPHEIGWFGFIDGRLPPLILLLCLIALPPGAYGARLARILEVASPVLAACSVAWMWAASAMFQDDAEGFAEVESAIPPCARLLNFPIDGDSRIFTGHPFVHYDKLLLARQPMVVSDIWFHQGSAIYPRPANPVLDLPSDYESSSIRQVNWARFRLDEWDYVLVRTRPHDAEPPVPVELSLTLHRGGWWLYRHRASAAAHDGG